MAEGYRSLVSGMVGQRSSSPDGSIWQLLCPVGKAGQLSGNRSNRSNVLYYAALLHSLSS